jgi:hypothetical protein
MTLSASGLVMKSSTERMVTGGVRVEVSVIFPTQDTAEAFQRIVMDACKGPYRESK